jgi:hypothetical protein
MRPAAILLLVLALPAQAGIARGPVLHASAPGTMTVTWDTAEEVVGKLEYGINGMVLDASEMTASNSGLRGRERPTARVLSGPG